MIKYCNDHELVNESIDLCNTYLFLHPELTNDVTKYIYYIRG